MRIWGEISERRRSSSSRSAAPANDHESVNYARARRMNADFIGVLDDFQQLAVLRAIFPPRRAMAGAIESGVR